MSKQHDGILCAPAEGRTWAELAEALTGACRRECGFEVTVEAKVVEDTGRAAELREWVRMVEAAEGEAMHRWTDAPVTGCTLTLGKPPTRAGTG